MGELITLIIVLFIAVILLIFSIMSFLERGLLLNNAFLYASKEEREKMDKKPYYKQSAIVFCILSVVFIVIALQILLKNDILFLLEIPLIMSVIIYWIVSTVQINKRSKK
ncbi:MAG: DUF3784 domain-containing protein [Lachnospiraceae bacterium]|nr:DUF3784 domain-containing protein [Lachnospiraceae bacterium]